MAKKRNPQDAVRADVKRLRAEVRERDKARRATDKFLARRIKALEKLLTT